MAQFECSALHFVSDKGENPRIAKVLLDADVDPDITNYYNQIALSLVQSRNRTEIASVIDLAWEVERPHALLIMVTVNWQGQKWGSRGALDRICARMQNRTHTQK